MAGEGFNAPHVDYAGISPIIALTVGLVVILMSGVFGPTRRWAPALTVLTLGAAAGLLLWHWNDNISLVAGALRVDNLAISISLISIAAAFFTVLLSVRERAADEAGHGEYYALLIGST